jgi:hypothetical protein
MNGLTPMFRSKELLKMVASLPCQHCGLEGSTQAAHANWAWSGKGMGIKAHDCYTAALCVSCHREVDQGKDMTKNEREEVWTNAWKKTILELWKRDLIKVS